MPIELDRKYVEYGKICQTIFTKNRREYVCEKDSKKYRITKESYGESDLFEKYVHSEITPTKTTFLYFKSYILNIKPNTIHFSDTNDLKGVDIYFSKIGKTNYPLALVINTSISYCYIFRLLKQLKGFKEIKNSIHFNRENLLDKLIEENNTQNNVITYRLDKKSSDDGSYDGVNVEKVKHPSFEKYKHTPLKQEGSRLAFVLYNGKTLILTGQSSYKGSDTKLTEIQKKSYCELNLYFFKQVKGTSTTELPIFLVLNEKSQSEDGNTGTTKTYCLKRSGDTWTNWKQIEDPGLDTVITFLIELRPEQSSSYNSIEVIKKKHTSFDVYEHKLQSSYHERKAYLLYKFQFLELQKSQSEVRPNLTEIQLHKCAKVSVYFFKSIGSSNNAEIPIYLELTEQKGGSTENSQKYYLQRTDGVGIKWRQIEDPSFDNVITFLINLSKIHQSYNDSVDVKSQTHDSFDVYQHTPKTGYDGRKAYLLYEFKFLDLDTTKSEGQPKLSEIHLKCYKFVRTYYFKSINNNYNAEIPIYLELEEKENSNKYHLQRTENSGIKWKQITDPSLITTITFLLDYKQYNPYNNNSVTVEKGNHVSFEIYTHKPNQTDKLGLLLYHSALIFLDNNKLPEGVDKLDKLEWKNYCEVSLYYFKLSNNGSSEIPRYLEIKVREPPESSSTKAYYLERTGTTAIYWTQISDPQLNNLITFLLDHSPEKGTSYNGGSVTVEEKIDPSFKVITHKPGNEHENKKAILRYNDKDLELVPNDHLPTGTTKLDKFNFHTYCSVRLYFYNENDQNTLPQFLELKERKGNAENGDQQDCTNTSKCYLFQRDDEQGLKWKQILYQDLRTTVTFQLEFITHGHSYNNGNISVTKTTRDSFDVYTHKPKDPNKLGLFLYNWKTLTLQPNDGLPSSTTRLYKLQGKKFCKVYVYLSKSHSSEPPFYLKLFENTGTDQSCQSSDTTSSNSYWLQRVDPKGYHWKQIKRPDLGPGEIQQITQDIRNNDKNSIMVQINQQGGYNMDLIKHYRFDGIGEPTKPYKTIFATHKPLTSSNYQYYEHDFSQSFGLSGLRIERLRTFIGTIEIKLCNAQGTEQKLEYIPIRDSSSKVNVYFATKDTFPLLIFYEDKWFYPTNKNEYLLKWIKKTEIPSKTRTDIIKRKLDEINKLFNEILLDSTSKDGYGISPPSEKQLPKGFNLDRVKVEQTQQSDTQNFEKVSHQTVNNSSIGAIKFKENELRDERNTKLSEVSEIKSETYTSVTAFYHKNDSGYDKPLLLGFTKSGGSIIDLFYERQNVGDDSKWKKIEHIIDLRQDDGIAKRVDKIRYTIGKSVIIRVDQRPREEGGGSYQVQLVENKDSSSTSGPTQSGSAEVITVTKNCSDNPSVTNYTCFNHEIPLLTESESGSTTHYVSGLKFYICKDKHLPTNLPIYYNPDNNQVKVYFYQHGTSVNPPVDKVPLLVEYNDTYFKPNSRDDYFTKWVKTEIPTGDGRGDTGGLSQIGNVLDGINKDLNTIELDKTGNGADNDKYGITPPKNSEGICTNGTGTPVKDFCNRVTVQRNVSQKQFYFMVTHKTVNQGPIGLFKYDGSEISGIKPEKETTTCNQVNVYYRANDTTYSQPLLIHITSESSESIYSCTGKWYSRISIKLTDWNDVQVTNSDVSSIKQELDKIQAKLSNYIFLQIHQQENEYEIITKTGTETKEQQAREHKGKISIDKYGACGSYKVTNYRCYQHQLYNYYRTYKSTIKESLKLDEEDPTLQVSIYIANKLINILGTDGNPLTYGPEDEKKGTSNDPYVYFYDLDNHGSDSPDTVPLLFNYGQRFFGFSTKNNYFNKWEEVKIEGGGTQNTVIKQKLDSINLDLNEIDLTQTGVISTSEGYGLEKSVEINHLTGFNTKRIEVTRSLKHGSGTSFFTYVTHSTTNGYNIGNITDLGSCKFDNKHTNELSNQKHNEAVAVYTSASTTLLGTPQLVLVAESKGKGSLGSGSIVHGYYDLTGDSDNRTYEFKEVTGGFTLDQITKENIKDDEQFLGILQRIGIIKAEVPQVQGSLQVELPDSTQGSELQEGVLSQRENDRDGGRSNDENQDDRPKVDLSQGASVPGGPDRMDSGAKAPQDLVRPPGAPGLVGPGGKNGETGEEGRRGEQGDRGIKGPSPTLQRTEDDSPSPPSPGRPTTSHTTNLGTQQHQNGGDLDGRGNGGRASPDSPQTGPEGERGAQTSSGGGFFNDIAKLANDKPVEFYGGTGGKVAGVGVIGTVGAVA